MDEAGTSVCVGATEAGNETGEAKAEFTCELAQQHIAAMLQDVPMPPGATEDYCPHPLLDPYRQMTEDLPDQGTDPHHRNRAKAIGFSEWTGVFVAKDPKRDKYAPTRDTFIKKKAFFVEKPKSFYTEFGNSYEDYVFHLYRKHCGGALVGWTKMGSVPHPNPRYANVLRGSPDMIVVLRTYNQDGTWQDEVRVLEIKTAPKRQIEFEKDDQGNDILSMAKVIPGHWSQLQGYLDLFGLEHGDLAQWKPDALGGKLYVTEVSRDADWFEEHATLAISAWEEVLNQREIVHRVAVFCRDALNLLDKGDMGWRDAYDYVLNMRDTLRDCMRTSNARPSTLKHNDHCPWNPWCAVRQTVHGPRLVCTGKYEWVDSKGNWWTPVSEAEKKILWDEEVLRTEQERKLISETIDPDYCRTMSTNVIKDGPDVDRLIEAGVVKIRLLPWTQESVSKSLGFTKCIIDLCEDDNDVFISRKGFHRGQPYKGIGEGKWQLGIELTTENMRAKWNRIADRLCYYMAIAEDPVVAPKKRDEEYDAQRMAIMKLAFKNTLYLGLTKQQDPTRNGTTNPTPIVNVWDDREDKRGEDEEPTKTDVYAITPGSVSKGQFEINRGYQTTDSKTGAFTPGSSYQLQASPHLVMLKDPVVASTTELPSYYLSKRPRDEDDVGGHDHEHGGHVEQNGADADQAPTDPAPSAPGDGVEGHDGHDDKRVKA